MSSVRRGLAWSRFGSSWQPRFGSSKEYKGQVLAIDAEGRLQIKWSNNDLTNLLEEEHDGLETMETMQLEESCLDCNGLRVEWEKFRDAMICTASECSGKRFIDVHDKDKTTILQALLKKPLACASYPTVLELMKIEAVIPSCAMEVERIFSAHNLVRK